MRLEEQADRDITKKTEMKYLTFGIKVCVVFSYMKFWLCVFLEAPQHRESNLLRGSHDTYPTDRGQEVLKGSQ